VKGSDRTWLGLAILALIVVLLYYLLEVQGIANTPGEASYVWDLEFEDVVGLRVVDNESGATTALERAGSDAWRLTEPVEGAADLSIVESLIYRVARMQVLRTIDEPKEELAAYGLLTPTHTVEVQTRQGQQLRLEVGGEGLNETLFVQREGEQALMVVDEYAVHDLLVIIDAPPTPASAPGMPVLGPSEERP